MKSRLAEFKIDGLFGLYSHRIVLNIEERITIVIGPNGRGKTVCLKFIEALFGKQFAYFMEIPFLKADFVFTGGERISIELVEESSEDLIEGKTFNKSIRFGLKAPEHQAIEWVPQSSNKIRKYLPPRWRQVGPDLWVDRTDGEECTLSDLSRRYRIPRGLIRQADLPEPFEALINNIDCHLIETQRLLVIPTRKIVDDEDDERVYIGPRRRARESQLAILQKAKKLQEIMGDTVTRYANRAQELDQSFPLRVFDSQYSAKLSEEQLRQELKQLDVRREALRNAGIFEPEFKTVTLRSGIIERGVAMALEIYVKDANEKLDVFDNLRARVDLFKDLIEKRFIDKTLQIDRESGFKIFSANHSEIPLDKLSSGEQHQLILIFDLLFQVNKDSFILIDEPELSLHITWQKTFIESLKRIIALNAFDVLLATHSPAILAKHFDLAVELGRVDEAST